MKNILKHVFSTMVCIVAASSHSVKAEDGLSHLFTAENLSLDDNFHSGRFEPSVGAGVLFSPMITGKGRPTENYALGDAQVGYMVTDLWGEGFLRGNFELAVEAFGAGIFSGTGNYVAGGTLWFRYNFVPHDWRVLPYAQVGGGLTSMDIDHRYDGMNFNFNVDAALGARYFIEPRLAVNLEYRFQHISNADLGRHNIGINAEGPVLAVSWFL